MPSQRSLAGELALEPRPASAAEPPPGEPAGLVGREDELAELHALVRESPLTTVVGAPGIGKSRLALELAGRLGRAFPGGAACAELAPFREEGDVGRALAAALSVEERAGEQLVDSLAARLAARPALVVLDNCEHLLGACAALARELCSRCPAARLVATSREPLGIRAERAWALSPLGVPEPGGEAAPEALMRHASVRLFVARAAAVQPSFRLTAYVAPAIAEICRRLDGIPLAIELAAARADSVTPEEMAGRLDERFELLRGPTVAGPAHHATLRAALDWSHGLLTERERELLAGLSVFEGDFDLAAATAVGAPPAGAAEGANRPIAALLDGLASKSLLTVAPGEDHRYRLLETIRAYAAERLEETGEVAAHRDAHAGFYIELAERAETELTGPCQRRALDALERDRANLRAAFAWLMAQGKAEPALRLAVALILHWRVRCRFEEGRELLEAALAAGEDAPAPLRAKALWGTGFMALMRGEVEPAGPSLEQSLAVFEALGDAAGRARALLLLGNRAQYLPDAEPLPLLERSARLARAAGDAWCLAHALGVMGLDHGARDDLVAARPLFEECLAVAREAGELQGLRLGLFGLGSVALRQGDFELAESVLGSAIGLTRELGEDYSLATATRYLGELASARGDRDRARELLERAAAMLREVGPPSGSAEAQASLGLLDEAGGDAASARRRYEEALILAGGPGADCSPPALGLARIAAADGRREAARELLERARERAREIGDKGGLAGALGGLGELAREEGRLRQAAALHREALELWHSIGAAPRAIGSLEALAGVAVAAGRHRRGARLLAAAAELRERGGYAALPWEASRSAADLAAAREALGAAELGQDLASGRRLSLAAAVREALRGPGSAHRPHSTGWASLTEAERRVAELVAEGLTNPQVAQRLFVSRGTVKFHLSNIYAKLGLGGRTELAREVERRRG